MSAPAFRRVVILLAAMAAAAGTARLGVWQLDRAAQKLAYAAALAQRQAMPELSTAQLARDPAGAAEQQHRRIRLQGRWLDAATVYLDNRQMNGRPGFFVVTPLLLANDDAVLVQRGWLPRALHDRSFVAALPAEPGEAQVLGRVAAPPSRLYEFDTAASGPIRQNLDVAAYAREVGVALRPLSVLQVDAPSATAVAPASAAAVGTAPTLLRQWPTPVADVSKHHGYAFQWFALSALIMGLYAWFQLIRPRRAA